MSWDTWPKTRLFYVLLTSKGGNIASSPIPSVQCCALVLATSRTQQTPQLWMERTGEECGFFCSPKLPCLSTMSQQFCRRLWVPREVTQNSFHRTQRMRITSSVIQDGVHVLVVNCFSFCSRQTVLIQEFTFLHLSITAKRLQDSVNHDDL